MAQLHKPNLATKIAADQGGFTIIELMIALSVLSVLLVMTTVTLIQIGKLYSKGVNSAAVQNAARNIVGDISGTLQFGGGAPAACTIYLPPAQTSSGTTVDGAPTCAADHITKAAPWGGTLDIYSYCIDTTRYSYVIDKQISTQPVDGQTYYALWKDTMNNNGSCYALNLTAKSAAGPSDPSTVPGSGQELVPDNMTLTNFSIQESPAGSGLYEMIIGLAYGDHDLLNIDPAGNVSCTGGIGHEYCGVSQLQTILARRLK